MTKHLRGFALVEVSIALLILGMITSITMSQLATLTKLRREQVTRDNMEFVVKALGAYYLNKNGRLPKPCNIASDGFGTIPYSAMGIMYRYSRDGYGRPLLYKCDAIAYGKTRSNETVTLFDVKNDIMLFEIKTVDGKQRVWYSEKVFTQVYCQGKTFRVLMPPATSLGAKF